MVLVPGLVLAGSALHAQDSELPHRTINQSLLIDLRQGEVPSTISASGLYSDMTTLTVAPGIVSYDVNSPLWSDGAWKERFIALPGEARIDFSPNGNWSFPPNTVLVKNFYLEERLGRPETRSLIETRFLVRHAEDDGWSGFSYKWDFDGQDAVLLKREETEAYFVFDDKAAGGLREHLHFFPNRTQCDQCHTGAAGFVLGVTTAQLNRQKDGIPQLAAMNQAGLFSNDIALDKLPAKVDPLDEDADLQLRARSYLAANCSHCHRPGAVDKADIDLRFETSLELTRTVNRVPTLAAFDLVEPRLIKPADPANSSLLQRTQALDSGRMPPLASEIVDVEGTRVVRRWIEAMDPVTTVIWQPTTPLRLRLHRNTPNPFNATTQVSYQLPTADRVRLEIIDVTGRHVRHLTDAHLPAGTHVARWDGRDDRGKHVASGVYIYRLQAGAMHRQRRLTLLK